MVPEHSDFKVFEGIVQIRGVRKAKRHFPETEFGGEAKPRRGRSILITAKYRLER